MQAIVTKYFGPTNVRGSRIKATCDAGSITVSWDHALNSEDNHDAAMCALAVKLGWYGRWVRGGMPQKSPFSYVYTPMPTSQSVRFQTVKVTR